MKKTKKVIFLIILVVVFIVTFNYNYVNAVTPAPSDGGFSSPSVSTNPDYYKPGSFDNPSGANTLKDIGNSLIGFLQIVGSILSVVVLVILGIKYMMGSAEERAEYKKTMKPYIIGAFMVFGITNILGIIATIAQDLL